MTTKTKIIIIIITHLKTQSEVVSEASAEIILFCGFPTFVVVVVRIIVVVVVCCCY